MWQPGKPKPGLSSPKHLSGSTMNMKFMKRNPESAMDHEKSPQLEVPISSVELYGAERSMILGRRSFFGFNSAMETAWKRTCGKDEKESRKDGDLLDQYKGFIKKRKHEDGDEIIELDESPGKNKRKRKNNKKKWRLSS